jgi:signal transduction histidine kinase
VFADPRQVEQVLGNLVTNACQAMVPRKSSPGETAPQAGSVPGVMDTGTLTISARRMKAPSKIGAQGGVPASANSSGSNVWKEEEMLAIAVKDTGTGITPENRKRLFEPLFTTKTRGIGLGLAVSLRLAEANGGWIDVESEPGHGSTFTLYLPLSP